MMSSELTILYRGALTSCNYGCHYCPFAKRTENKAQQAYDKSTLQRFVDWAIASDLALNLFFTPWGEALIRRHYQQATIALSHASHVKKVVFQTNLSFRPEFLLETKKEKVALWTTYHPSEVSKEHFLQHCHWLLEAGIRFSVGIVGKPGYFDEISAIRRALPKEIYLWINAYRQGTKPYRYTEEQQHFLQRIDPFFADNCDHPSRGKTCLTGEHVISVDEKGTIRRCHFIPNILGNLYLPDFKTRLFPRPCRRATCHCHIGYIHMPELALYSRYERGLLERIPSRFSWQDP